LNITTALTTSVIRTQNCAAAVPAENAAVAVPQAEVFVKSEAAAAPAGAPAPAPEPKKSEPKPAPKPEFDPDEATPRRDGDDGPGLGGGYPPVLERAASRNPRVLADGLIDADGPTLGGGYFGPPEADGPMLPVVAYDDCEMLLFGS
jgi:hypothetical protein